VQTKLNVTADGRMGPETQNALKQFQATNGLKATGQLDQETIAALEKSQGSAAVGGSKAEKKTEGSAAAGGSASGGAAGSSTTEQKPQQPPAPPAKTEGEKKY
jgi:peptidoglycan hydrolase-like protein with peptidoglycan-binding domain